MEFNRFDVSAKELIWDDPVAWLDRLAIGPRGPVRVIDSNITTLTADADKVLRVDGAGPYLVNIELQSSHQSDLIETTWFRQAALYHRHRLPVLTVIVLLRPDANSPGLNGEFTIAMPDGHITNRYNYRVVRLWEEGPQTYLDAGASLVPLAPLTNVPETEEALRDLVRRMADRINVQDRPRAEKLWMATYLLMGLRFPSDLATRLLEGAREMRESTTYQAILQEGREEGREAGREEGREAGREAGREEGREEGRLDEARRFLLMLGEQRFGTPGPTIRNRVVAIRDIERIERTARRVLDATIADWNALLKTP